MLMRRRTFILSLVAVGATGGANAAEWPERGSTFVVPFPAGGSTDIVARLFAERFAERLRQSFVVENRPGANGNIAAAAVAKAQPDGYTILVSGNGQNAMNHSLYARMSYDSIKDFEHICLLAMTPNVIIVPAASPIRTLEELIAGARRSGGDLSFASPGAGSSGHLSLAMLEGAAKIKARHVPYRGAAPLVTDILGGHVSAGIVNADIPLSHIQGGKIRALAVTSSSRSPLYPDVPTVAESGFPGFEAQGWFGLSAPAKTPRTIVEKMNKLANEVLKEEKIKQRFAAGGYVAGGGSPDDYAQFIGREITKWAAVVQENGISIE